MNEGQPIINGQPVASGGGQPITSGQQPASAPQVPINAGTGDIVLVPSNKKKPKRGLIIGVLVAAVLVLVGVVVALLISNNYSNNSAQSEYEESFNVLFEYSPIIVQINSFVEDGRYGKTNATDFFQSSTVETTRNLRESLSELESTLRKLDYSQFSEEDKTILKNFAENDLLQYISVAGTILDKTQTLCEDFVNAAYDELNQYAADNSLSIIVKNNIMKYAEAYAEIKPVIEICEQNNNSNDCRSSFHSLLEYENMTEEDTETVKAVFASMVSEDDVEMLKQFSIRMNEVRTMVEVKYKGNTNE